MVFTKKQYENVYECPYLTPPVLLLTPLLPLTASPTPTKRPTVFECLSPKQQSVLLFPCKAIHFHSHFESPRIFLLHPAVLTASLTAVLHINTVQTAPVSTAARLQYLSLQRGPRYCINKRKCSEADTPPGNHEYLVKRQKLRRKIFDRLHAL